MDIQETAETFIADAKQKPSEKFGNLVLEVDHKALGRLVREVRWKHAVKAVDVAEILGVTKVQLHFMEKGRKHWDLKTLKRYLQAVVKLSQPPKTNGVAQP